jgi:predicted TIM-barrel fold metal-dependent hydrolase
MAEPDLLGFIQRAGLSAEEASKILGRNAAHLLGLDAEVTRRSAREIQA